MARSIQDKINQALRATENLYHRLVLLVGENGSGKTKALRDLAECNDTVIINVNLELSAELLELTGKQRDLRLPGLLAQLGNKASSPIVFDNLEILFDIGLKQDPLRLLQGISRNRSVVASWNGSLADGKLLYAQKGHPEYRRYDVDDILIVSMDGRVTFESANK